MYSIRSHIVRDSSKPSCRHLCSSRRSHRLSSGPDDKGVADLAPIAHDRLEWTGRSAAIHFVGATSKPPIESGALLQRGRNTSAGKRRDYGVLVATKDPLVQEVLQSHPDRLKKLVGSLGDGGRADCGSGALRWARATCCNALYPMASARERQDPQDLSQEIVSRQEQIRRDEEEILNLDLQFKQGLISDEEIVAARIESLAARVAAGKLQLEQCFSQIEDGEVAHVARFLPGKESSKMIRATPCAPARLEKMRLSSTSVPFELLRTGGRESSRHADKL